jgi:thymidylate synthase (FAD)
MSMCYGKQCTTKGLQKSIEAGHLSLLEHAMATFEIECSLAVLGQITRHRHLSFTVKSTRGAEFDNYVIPEELSEIEHEIFDELIGGAINNYEHAIRDNVSLESSAYLLPKATLTKLYISGNLRAWYEYLPKRLCQRALPEHRIIAERIHSELSLVMPEIFADVTAPCDNCKESSCKF